jgi:hypothetical protein
MVFVLRVMDDEQTRIKHSSQEKITVVVVAVVVWNKLFYKKYF